VLLAVIEAAQRRPRLRLVNGSAVIETSFDLEPRVGRGTRSELLATYSARRGEELAIRRPGARSPACGPPPLVFSRSRRNLINIQERSRGTSAGYEHQGDGRPLLQ
jgi:hypothetical protein